MAIETITELELDFERLAKAIIKDARRCALDPHEYEEVERWINTDSDDGWSFVTTCEQARRKPEAVKAELLMRINVLKDHLKA